MPTVGQSSAEQEGDCGDSLVTKSRGTMKLEVKAWRDYGRPQIVDYGRRL